MDIKFSKKSIKDMGNISRNDEEILVNYPHLKEVVFLL